MALGPTPQQGYVPPPVQGGSPRVYTPPRRLLFASNITNSVGERTLSKVEIDQAIRQHGTNIAIMVDPGGINTAWPEVTDMLRYAREKGIQHIGIYGEGRTGPTNGRNEPKEMARKGAMMRKYGMSESQWMGGGWERAFHDQVRYFAQHHNAKFFEADNIPPGQAVRYLKQFQAAKNRGELPAHVQMLIKNPYPNEINQLRAALEDGSVKRESVADFAISEGGYRSSWPALRKGFAELGIQLACSHRSDEYAAKETYDQSLLGALGKFVKDVVHGIAQVVTAPFRFLGELFSGQLGKPVSPKPEPPKPELHRAEPPKLHSQSAPYAQTQLPRPVAPTLHPVQSRELPLATQWRFNGSAAPIQKQPEPVITPPLAPRWIFKSAEPAEQAPRQRPA